LRGDFFFDHDAYFTLFSHWIQGKDYDKLLTLKPFLTNKEVNNMPRILRPLAVLVLLFSIYATASSNAANPEIVVSGKGIIEAKADLAQIDIGVEQTDKSALKAQQTTSQNMQKVVAGLKNIGIPKDKIQTEQINLFPQYRYDNRQRTLIGYTARNIVRVTVEKLDLVGKIIDTSISSGANNINSIMFSVKDESPFKRDALKKAYENAKGKADEIAKVSGLTIAKIKQINEEGAQIFPQVQKLAEYRAEGIGGAETPVSPGNIKIQGSLTVIYECK
jgi:uncharacterized protein YggE